MLQLRQFSGVFPLQGVYLGSVLASKDAKALERWSITQPACIEWSGLPLWDCPRGYIFMRDMSLLTVRQD